MIQEIRIKNFMSFKDEVVISFEATKDTFAEDSQVVKINDKTRLLRFAVVYGYNASGKSNLLKAIEFLSNFLNCQPDDMNLETGVVPFKLDTQSPFEHTMFEVIFYVGTIKYTYLLELDSKQVYLEKLSYYKTEQPTMLFDRRNQNGQSVISFNSALKISKIVNESITVNCLKNMSVFAARGQVNTTIPLIDNAKNYFYNQVESLIRPSSNLSKGIKSMLTKDKQFLNYVLNFLREADFNISDVASWPDNETIVIHSVENEKGIKKYDLCLDEGEESLGTLKTLGIEMNIYRSLQSNSFLPIDEIETSLHPKLLEKILYEFLKVKNSRSQLIVTTHNDGLLDLTDDLIRKDSVWFTEKQKNGSTELYKLTDFKGVNRLSSIREAYRNKRFGATMNN